MRAHQITSPLAYARGTDLFIPSDVAALIFCTHPSIISIAGLQIGETRRESSPKLNTKAGRWFGPRMNADGTP